MLPKTPRRIQNDVFMLFLSQEKVTRKNQRHIKISRQEQDSNEKKTTGFFGEQRY